MMDQQYPKKADNNDSKDNVEYRKIQTILGDVSFSIVLPKLYAVNMGLKKGAFVRVYQQENRIVIEKAT
jgi:hypothetical protein